MGQFWAKKDPIPELSNVKLEGVVPLNEELGHGAYGSVFTVKYKENVFAAKKIHSNLIENVSDEEKQGIKADFIQECLRCSSISHPNIVEFVGVYYPKGSSFPIMVMELMSSSLTSYLENNKKSKIFFHRKISILHDVSTGLSFLHSRKPKMLHRDLSSNNVMLTIELVAKIGDLGVAKVIRADNRQTKSKLTTAPGTVPFMPPEALVEDNPEYDTPIDVFSFGGIALHVFSEEWPTPGRQKIRDSKTKKLVALSEVERRQRYLDRMTGKAAGLKEMVKQCLDDDPRERPTIQEVSKAFKIFKTQYSQGKSDEISTKQKKAEPKKKQVKMIKPRAPIQKKAEPKKKQVKMIKPRAPVCTTEMIIAAITATKEQGGTSWQKIVRYISANYEVSVMFEARTSLALDRMVRAGILIKTKGAGTSGFFKMAKKSMEPAKKKPVSKKKSSTTKKTGEAKKKPATNKTAAAKKKAAPRKDSKPKTAKKPAVKKPAAKKLAAKKLKAKCI